MSMPGLKQELLEKVPSHLKETPHFVALLDHIKQKNISSKEHLVDYLGKEIVILEKWMGDNRKMSAKALREKVVHLDLLKKTKSLALEFLF